MLVRQSSFHGGEVAPNLYSRTDIETRRFAVRKLLNFISTPTGAALNRPGFQFIAETKDSTQASRLVPFTFSTTQAYLLEFGHLYVRPYQNGARVSNGAGGYVEVVTPYTASDLARMQFVQSGDTLTITHPSYAPRELKRTGATSWTISTFSVLRLASAPNAPSFLQTPQTVDDSTHKARAWDWVVTAVVSDEESKASTALQSASVVVAPDRPVYVGTNTVTGATLYYWYRGRYGIYGYVGSSKNPSFADEGQVPNYSDRPPTERDPFVNSEYPAVATYFEQRLAFANQPSYPQRVVMSQTGRFHNFDYSLPQKDDDAADFTVASRQYEEIRALVPLQQFVILTANTEFVVDNGGDPISPSKIRLIPVGYNGSSWLRPVVIGDAVLFVHAQQSAVRELVFGGQQGWGGGDISLVANHLLASNGRTLTDWTYQRLPYSVIWGVRDDGSLLSLTYAREFNVAAWAQHSTDGVFESVCAIPEGPEDALYAIVRRTINGSTKRYIERAATRQVTDVKLGCFLDCSVFYDGAPAQAFGGLSHLEGKSVTVLADGVVRTGFTVSAGNLTPNLPTPASKVFIGLPYNSDIELLDLALSDREARGLPKNVSKVIWEVDRTAGLQSGETLASLVPWVKELGYALPAAGIDNEQFVVPINSSWNRGGRAALRQSQPLPVTVIGVTRDVTLGDD